MAKSQELSMWVQQSNHGGFSDDKFLGIKESFLYAKGIEIRRNPHSITLAKKAIKDTADVIDSLVMKMVTISSTSDIIAFGANGKIWKNTGSTGTWTLVYTDSSNRKILNAIEFEDRLFWVTSDYLHFIPIANIDHDWTGVSGVTENFAEFTNKNVNSHPMLTYAGRLHIGDGHLISMLDAFDVWTPDRVVLQVGEEARAITFSGNLMRIYTRRSHRVNSGHCYLWDGASKSFNEMIMWEGLVIHSAVNVDGLDYVIAGVKPTLFVSTGYKRSALKRLPFFDGTYKGWINPNAIDVHDNLVAIGVADINTTSPIGRGVWTFGQDTANYPNSLNFEFPTSNDNSTDVIGCVHSSNGVLYFSWKNGTSYGIDKISETIYRQSGELQSRVMVGALPSNWKHILEVAIAYGTLKANHKISLYLKKNMPASWGNAVLTADYNVADDLQNVYKVVNDPFTDGDFHYLQTRVVLETGSSSTTTPELLQIAVVYDETIDKDE